MDKTTSLGIMSGSSLDGLDVCMATFQRTNSRWSYEFLDTQTLTIPENMQAQLSTSHLLGERDLKELDRAYGNWIGHQIKSYANKVDLVSVHGHTVRHAPLDGYSLQIGDAREIADITGKKTVADFRNLDIELCGQGAPLVPMGERELFHEYDGFLNLGGICNATFRKSDQSWIAGDIGPFNQVFNRYSKKLGKIFDKGGQMAREGSVIESLIHQWSQLSYFSQEQFPKSLGNAWVREHFFAQGQDAKDVLATFSEFISSEIARTINGHNPNRVIITGGGAYNTYFIEKLKSKTDVELVIPSKWLVDFKEALIFGFLGVLRVQGEVNVLSSCTGASQDSSSGKVFLPKQSF